MPPQRTLIRVGIKVGTGWIPVLRRDRRQWRGCAVPAFPNGLMRLRPYCTVMRQSEEESTFAFGSRDCLLPLGLFLSRED
jgi:hypothetical protein